MQDKFSTEKKNNIDLSEIKSRINLSEFGRSALGLKINKNKTMCCHIHKELTPSLHFNDEKRFYYCFGCHKSGDVFSLVQEIKHCSFLESIKFVASYTGINIEEFVSDYNFLRNSSEIKEKKDILYKMMEDISLYFEEKLYQFNNDEISKVSSSEVLSYLYNRQIDDNLIKKFRIGYCPNNIDDLITILKQKYTFSINLLLDSGIFRKSTNYNYTNQKNNGFYSILQNRIIFPIFDKFNKIIAFGGRIFGSQKNNINQNKKIPKYINASDSLIFKKNENLYGENFALKDSKMKNQMILVEGYIDVIMMHKAGFKNCVAPLGTAIQEAQMKSLWGICDEITCCMDGDLAGFKSMISILEKALKIISAQKFINFIFLEKNLDPADLIEQNKANELGLFLETKKRYPAFIIFNIVLKKYKKITAETIAAIRSSLNSYLDMISDSIIKNEYQIYFDKKIESLTKKNEENQEPIPFFKKEKYNNFNKNYNFKRELSIFDEIFLSTILFLEKFSDNQEFKSEFLKNFHLFKDFFQNHQDLIKILEQNNKNNNQIISILKNNPRYFQIDFDFFLEKMSNEIFEKSQTKDPKELFNKLIILKIKIIFIKNKQKILEEKIAKNNNDLSSDDFEQLSSLISEQKKLQNDLSDN